MILKRWENLPPEMQSEAVREYYNILRKKRLSLVCKRIFDIVISFTLLVVLLPLFILIAIAIKLDSKGPIFYRQVRVTQYNKNFRIFKFRSMTAGADKHSQLTANEDIRITRVGRVIRRFRLDELGQLIDVLRGKMTLVGTRPEVPKFTGCYTDKMMATLLLPAGVTSLTSICFKNEENMLDATENMERVYIDEILPAKMQYNLMEIENLGFWRDIRIIFMTLFAMLGKEYRTINV